LKSEILNSRELVKFLELHKFCPEILVSPLSLIFQDKEKQGFEVKESFFISSYNLFILLCNNKKQNKAQLKLFSFKDTNLVDDSFYITQKKT